MKEPAFLTLAEVLKIHKIQIELFGGDYGLRDLRLLESAVLLPQSRFGGKFLHASVFEMAAAYAYHISENHPFLDGNKRTGLAAALVFLEMNGIAVDDPEGRLFDAMMKIAGRQMDKKSLGKLLENLSRKAR